MNFKLLKCKIKKSKLLKMDKNYLKIKLTTIIKKQILKLIKSKLILFYCNYFNYYYYFF